MTMVVLLNCIDTLFRTMLHILLESIPYCWVVYDIPTVEMCVFVLFKSYLMIILYFDRRMEQQKIQILKYKLKVHSVLRIWSGTDSTQSNQVGAPFTLSGLGSLCQYVHDLHGFKWT